MDAIIKARDRRVWLRPDFKLWLKAVKFFHDEDILLSLKCRLCNQTLAIEQGGDVTCDCRRRVRG